MDMKYCFKTIALSILCMMVLAGCGSVRKSGVSGSEGRIVTLADGRKVVVGGQTLAPPKSSAKDAKPQSKKSKKPQDASPADREAVGTTVICSDTDKHTHQSQGDYVSSGSASVAPVKDDLKGVPVDDFSLNGEWTIYSVRGNLVTGEERPYVSFDLPARRFYGNNGCNYINGDLTVESNQGVKFGNMISTLKMCQNDQFQYLINLALNDVVSYSVRQDKRITFLDMKDSTGRVILVLRRHNMDFLNGAWKVAELNGSPLIQDDDATMTFDTSDLKIHGTTGCNIFNGELFIDPDKTDSLQILKLATTRMACPPGSRETEFLLALESVETARPVNMNETVLYDTEGKPLFRLVKMDLRPGADDVE